MWDQRYLHGLECRDSLSLAAQRSEVEAKIQVLELEPELDFRKDAFAVASNTSVRLLVFSELFVYTCTYTGKPDLS